MFRSRSVSAAARGVEKNGGRLDPEALIRKRWPDYHASALRSNSGHVTICAASEDMIPVAAPSSDRRHPQATPCAPQSDPGGRRVTGAPVVSIVICTRNRARALAATLATVARTQIPRMLPAELLVVDNGSTDDTRSVIGAFAPTPCMVAVRTLHVADRGLARARNAALRAAAGRVIVFLDDDTHPGPRWLEPLCAPILTGAADAVAGGVGLAAHLERPWMTPRHRTWLASTEWLDAGAPQEMVGANMALGRHVLATVPGFDVELGAGALGYGEEALFSQQLLRAGFRIAAAFDAMTEHHLDPARLTRAGFVEAAELRGRTLAYRRHHWEHAEVPHRARRLRRRWLRLALGRLTHRRPALEGMPDWEMSLREDVAFLRQWRIEHARPRNYERHGLVKRAGLAA